MASEYSVDFDWMTELQEHSENWTNLGRDAVINHCKHFDKDKDCNNVSYQGYCEKCDVSEDSQEPMMNYGYPLYSEPDEDEILAVVRNTCLTVMRKEDTGECFLVLCGGGMDLSQSIGLAYILAGQRIPHSLCMRICLQPQLSIGGKDFKKVMRAIKQDIKYEIADCRQRLKQIKEALQKNKEMMNPKVKA